MKKYDVVTVGLECIDVVTAPTRENPMERTVSTVDFVRLELGGDATNQAIALSKLGARVALMGASGSDPFEGVFRSMLSEYNIELLNGRADAATCVSIVLVEDDGERHFVCHPGANDKLCYAHLDEGALRSAEFVSIGSCLYLPELDGEGVVRTLDVAKGAGARTAVDFRIGERGFDPVELREVLRRADYTLPSEEEAAALTGEREDPRRMVEGLRDLGATNCIVKLGAKGCYVAADGFEGMVPTYPCNCVDTTGAGDTFVGAFLYAKLRGWDIDRCARFANAAGSIAVEHPGANRALKSEAQVLDRMAGRG